MHGETENTDIRNPNSALDTASSTFSVHKSLRSEIPYRKVNPLNVTTHKSPQNAVRRQRRFIGFWLYLPINLFLKIK
jgi:hypothetical protein